MLGICVKRLIKHIEGFLKPTLFRVDIAKVEVPPGLTRALCHYILPNTRLVLPNAVPLKGSSYKKQQYYSH
jgi:hypothetical protein